MDNWDVILQFRRGISPQGQVRTLEQGMRPEKQDTVPDAVRKIFRPMESSGVTAIVKNRVATRSGIGCFLRRFAIPNSVVSLIYYLKYRAQISLRAEVELSEFLIFGPKCTVSSFTKIKATYGHLRIGERSIISTGCFLSSSEAGVDIGKNFLCGPNVNVIGNSYVYDQVGVSLVEQGTTSKGIRIGDNVFVGAGSTVLDGAEIGDDTIVVPNSLVSGRFPPRSILQGNPAEVIFTRRSGKKKTVSQETVEHKLEALTEASANHNGNALP